MSVDVSIVIPAYNNADFLAQTIDSVLSQTHQDFELIVADHSSSDGTWEVMQKYADDPRVTLLQTDAGGGALRNWNRVSQAATGTFIKLVCGDDVLFPDIVSRQREALAANPEAVLAASPRTIVDAEGATIIRSRGMAGLDGTRSGAAAVRIASHTGTNPFGEPACVMMRRADLEAVGWWDSRWGYLIDLTTYTRVLLRGDCIGVGREPLASFRVSAGQWSVRLAAEQAQQTIAYYRWLRAEHPGVLSRMDEIIGSGRARINAILRRLVYAYMAKRMTTSGPESTARG